MPNHDEEFNRARHGHLNVAPENFIDTFCSEKSGSSKAHTQEQLTNFQALRKAIDYAFGVPYGAPEEARAALRINGLHYSKSVTLPVAEITLPNNAGKLVLRNNFHDTVITFELARPLPKNTFGKVGFFDPSVDESASCCEGFDHKRVYKGFHKDQVVFESPVYFG